MFDHYPLNPYDITHRLKEKLDRRECDHQEEVDILQSTIRELKNKVSLLENAIEDRQREVMAIEA